jgi:RecB family exonuclease
MALARVAPGVVAGDPWLGPIAKRGGRAWLRILESLDEGQGILMDRVGSLRIVGQGDDEVASRARLFLALMRGVEQLLLTAGLLDPRREAETLADLIVHREPAEVLEALPSAQLAARGITDWRASDLALWRALDAALSHVGGRAVVELPVVDKPLDAERARDPLEALIEAVAGALDDAPTLSPVKSAVGDLVARVSSQSQGVEVRQALSIESQGQAIADAVERSLEEGVAPEEIVVALVSDEERVARAVLRALREASIPCADARRVRSRSSNLVAFAERTIAVAEEGATRGDVALLLRSSYVDPRAILGEVDTDSGRKMLRDLSRALEETPTAAGETPAARLAATVLRAPLVRRRGMAGLGQAALRLGQMLDRVRTAATRSEQVRAVRALWRDIGLDVSPPPSAALSRAVGRIDLEDLAARERDAEAWRSLSLALRVYEESAALLQANEPASLQTFRDELFSSVARQACEERLVSAAVRLVRFADLAPGVGRVVILADADDGAWRDGDSSDLVPSDLALRLDAVTDPTLRPIFSSRGNSALARLVLGTSNAERVVFSYRARSDAGDVMSPALIVALAGGPRSVFRPVAWHSRPLSEGQWIMRELARRPNAAPDLAPEASRRSALERLREESFGEEIPTEHPLAVTLPRGEPFRTVLTEESGGGDRALAASSLDALAACVFRGFVGEVLRPRRSHRADDMVSRREEGQLTHLALDAAFRSTAGLWSARPRDGEAIRRVALAAAERVLSREHFASRLTRLTVDQVLRATHAVIEWSLEDERWDFVSSEQPFGDDEGWQPVILEAGGTRVKVRGRIDRVDVSHDNGQLRVIDYKARERSAESHTQAFGTTKFQLALYARAAGVAMDRVARDGLYLATQRLRPGALPKKQHEQWEYAHEPVSGVPRFERRLTDLVETLRAGDLAVRPVTPSSCAQCDFDGVCRKPRFAALAPVEDADTEEAR